MLLFIAALFVAKNFISLAFVVAAIIAIVAVSGISFKTIRKSLKPLTFIIVLTAIINLFYGTGEPLVQFSIFKITLDGIYKAIFRC